MSDISLKWKRLQEEKDMQVIDALFRKNKKNN